jgi:folylpolyglutamate synthase/dihydropteroate synthase
LSTTQFDRCLKHKEIWIKSLDSNSENRQTIICHSTIQNALNFIESIRENNSSANINVLVTGSLHLVGGVLKLIKVTHEETSRKNEDNSKKIKANDEDGQAIKRLRTV